MPSRVASNAPSLEMVTAHAADAPVHQQPGTLGKIVHPGEQRDLVVGDLQKIHCGKGTAHLLHGLIPALPQQRTVIGVVRDDGAGGLCKLHGSLCGGAHRLVRQRERAKVKNAAVCDQIPVQLLRRDLGIRAGLAGKGKASLPGFGEFYECQRGKIAGIYQQRPGIHTDALERLRQKAPLEIIADLADKGGAAPQLCGAGQHIGRAPPGFCSKTAMPASESGRGV